MRKYVEFELCGETIELAVDMRVIEVVERVYNKNVDMVAAAVLTNPMSIRLTDIADVIMGWVAHKNLDLSRRDIKNHIYTASQDDLNVLIGCIQAACLYMRRHITDEQFDTLVRGEDLPPEPVADEDKEEAEADAKKKPSRSSGRKKRTA